MLAINFLIKLYLSVGVYKNMPKLLQLLMTNCFNVCNRMLVTEKQAEKNGYY